MALLEVGSLIVVIVTTYLNHTSKYITLSASLNGGEAFEIYWFLTAADRDADGVKFIEK